jgi:hypothetical protein
MRPARPGTQQPLQTKSQITTRSDVAAAFGAAAAGGPSPSGGARQRRALAARLAEAPRGHKPGQGSSRTYVVCDGDIAIGCYGLAGAPAQTIVQPVLPGHHGPLVHASDPAPCPPRTNPLTTRSRPSLPSGSAGCRGDRGNHRLRAGAGGLRAERHGWDASAVSLAGWFVPDTTVSLWTGLWPNAVLNTVFGLAFAVPLIATRGCFRGR